MAFIFSYMMYFLNWAVSSTSKLLSSVFNEMVCNLFFKILLMFLLLESGDIEMNLINSLNNPLSILHSNIRSIRNEFDYLTENFLDFDILCFSESHLDATINTESLIMSSKYVYINDIAEHLLSLTRLFADDSSLFYSAARWYN